MRDVIKSFFDITKLPSKFFLVFSFVSGFFIFADDKLIRKLKLEKFDEFAQYIGAIFLFSTVLVIINLLIWFFHFILIKIHIIKLKKDFCFKLKRLDSYEQAVLREFYITQKNSLKMPIDDPVVAGLLNKNILTYNQQFGGSVISSGGFDFILSITPIAQKCLTFEDINLSNEETEENINFLKNNRPAWVHRINRWDKLMEMW